MKLLIVEDDAEIRAFLKHGLEAENASVDIAEDGERGVFLARTNEYDVILLDNMLPEKMGIEVCKEIRKAQKSVPIIVLSALSDTSIKIKLLEAGADDYMTKPFSIEELRARIKALARRPKDMEHDVLSIDNLVLDIQRCEVTRGGKSIYLTRKEFALLEYFLRNRGFALSRAMMMEHVWDMHADPFSNTIESHVLSLRRKIENPKYAKLIHTIPGRGYKMEVRKES